MSKGMGEESHPKHKSLRAFFKSARDVAKSLYQNRKGWKRMDPCLREALFLAVSVKNKCKFCFTVHSRLAQKAGISKAEISAIVKEDKSLFDERTKSAIEFALRMRNCEDKIESDVMSELMKYFKAEEASAIESAVKFITFANKLFNIFFPPLELEKAESITKE